MGGRGVLWWCAVLLGTVGIPLLAGVPTPAAIVTVGLEAIPDQPELSASEQERLSALQAVQRPHILSTLSPDGTTLLVAVDSPLSPEQLTLYFLDLPTGDLTEATDLLDVVVSPAGLVRWVDNNTLRFLQQGVFGPWEIVTLNRVTGIVSRTQVAPLGEEAGEVLGISPDFSRLAIRVYDGDEDVVFLVSLNTLQRLEVARLPQDFTLQPPTWSANGQYMALVATATDAQQLYDRSPNSPNFASTVVQDALGRTPPQDNPFRQHNWVRLFDLSQSEPLQVELRADLDQGNNHGDNHGDSFADAYFSPDGRRLLVKRHRPAHLAGRPHPTYLFPDSAYYQVYDRDGTLLHTIDEPALQGPYESQGWFLGQDQLLFWASAGHQRPLWVYDLGTDSTADSSPDLSPDSSADSRAELSTELSTELNPDLRPQPRQSRLRPLPLPPGSVDPAALALSPSGDTIIYGFSSVTQLPELFRWRSNDPSPSAPLTQVNADLQSVNRVQYQPVQFATQNGPRQGFLVQPEGQAFPPQGVPLVFWQEGGPGFSMANEFAAEVEIPLNLLPNFGIAVLVVPLTGREGFGSAFYRGQADHQNFGHIDLVEGRDIIQQVVQMGWARANQIGVSGCSYGGYFAAQSLRQFPGLFAAANPQCSLLDTLTEWQLGYSALLSYLVGQSPMEDPAAYIANSPLYGTTAITTPTLMFHGTEDFLQIDVARNFHDMLDAAGAPVTLYQFEGMGHGISDPHFQNLAAQIQIQFFRQYLTPNSY